MNFIKNKICLVIFFVLTNLNANYNVEILDNKKGITLIKLTDPFSLKSECFLNLSNKDEYSGAEISIYPLVKNAYVNFTIFNGKREFADIYTYKVDDLKSIEVKPNYLNKNISTEIYNNLIKDFSKASKLIFKVEMTGRKTYLNKHANIVEVDLTFFDEMLQKAIDCK